MKGIKCDHVGMDFFHPLGFSIVKVRSYGSTMNAIKPHSPSGQFKKLQSEKPAKFLPS